MSVPGGEWIKIYNAARESRLRLENVIAFKTLFSIDKMLGNLMKITAAENTTKRRVRLMMQLSN